MGASAAIRSFLQARCARVPDQRQSCVHVASAFAKSSGGQVVHADYVLVDNSPPTRTTEEVRSGAFSNHESRPSK
jgi:hypothetical protein